MQFYLKAKNWRFPIEGQKKNFMVGSLSLFAVRHTIHAGRTVDLENLFVQTESALHTLHAANTNRALDVIIIQQPCRSTFSLLRPRPVLPLGYGKGSISLTYCRRDQPSDWPISRRALEEPKANTHDWGLRFRGVTGRQSRNQCQGPIFFRIPR